MTGVQTCALPIFGFFIAKTLIERSGATLMAANGSNGRGAIVTIIWPREEFAVSMDATATAATRRQ